MSKRKEHSVTSFQEDWLTNDNYKNLGEESGQPQNGILHTL